MIKTSVTLLALVLLQAPAWAETIRLTCEVEFTRCRSSRCVQWKPILEIDTSDRTVTANKDVYNDDEIEFEDVRINESEIRFSKGVRRYSLNRHTGEFVADFTETQLGGTMRGSCEVARRRF